MKYSPDLMKSVKEFSAPLFSHSSRQSPLNPMVLMPSIRRCCDKTFSILSRPSLPLVFTIQGTRLCAMYHGVCSECKTSYYPSHSFCSQNNIEIFSNIGEVKYFQVTSATAFEVSYLEQVTNTLSLCSTTFEAVANTYNANHNSLDKKLMEHLSDYGREKTEAPWMLHQQRLEEGWFLYQIVRYWQNLGQFDVNMFTENSASNRRNIEELCRRIAVDLAQRPPKWVKHMCATKGCIEGYATIDGNEKISRTMCSAPTNKVFLPAGRVSVMQCCPQSPMTGGKHCTASKYCPNHQYLESCNEDGVAVDVSKDPANISVERIVKEGKDVGQSLPANDSSASGCCKKERNVNRYYNRTAGIAAIVRPCGIVVNFCEMYTCESMTQMYLFVALTFGHGDHIKRLKYLGYDRSCALEPFLQNRLKEGAYFDKFLLKNVKFLVDRFHVAKHTELCCMPPLNPLCKYHPDLPEFSELTGCNTQSAEQAFRWLNRFKNGLRHMSRYKFNLFLYTMIDTHNRFREENLVLCS